MRGTRGSKARRHEHIETPAYTGNGQDAYGLTHRTPRGSYEYGIWPASPNGKKQRILHDHRTLTALDHQQPGENGSGFHVFPMEPQRKGTGPLCQVSA